MLIVIATMDSASVLLVIALYQVDQSHVCIWVDHSAGVEQGKSVHERVTYLILAYV